jgi:hypothetical protein
MKGMLKMLRMPLEGQHHLGMDDVSNLYKIMKQIISEDGKMEPTGFARNLGAGAKGIANGKGASKKGKMDGKSNSKNDFGGSFKGKDFKAKGFAKGKGKGKKSFNHVATDGMGFAKAQQPTVDISAAATGLKRPAGEPPADAPLATARRKESWNPWDTMEATVEETLPPEQAELKDFLRGAPRPGEDWEFEDSAEEEVPVKKISQENGVGLAGVLGNDGANLQSSEAPPAKATSLASLFASLPKPMSTSE